MLSTTNALSVCGSGGTNNEEEDMRCFFCHETAFHVPALAAYRLCGCPASPLICAYCCLSKDKCFCSECGTRFDKQVLREKGQYLKKLQIQAAKQSQHALNVSQQSAFFPAAQGAIMQQQCSGMQGQPRSLQTVSLQQSQQQQYPFSMNNLPSSWTNGASQTPFSQQGQGGQNCLAESVSFPLIEARHDNSDLVMEAYSINSASSGEYSQQSQQTSRSLVVKQGLSCQQYSSSSTRSSASTASTLMHSSLSSCGSLQQQQQQPINQVNQLNNNNNCRFSNAQQQQHQQQFQQSSQQQGFPFNQQSPGMLSQQYENSNGTTQIQYPQQHHQSMCSQGQQSFAQAQHKPQINQQAQIFQQNNPNNSNISTGFSCNRGQTMNPFGQQQQQQQQQIQVIPQHSQNRIPNQYNNYNNNNQYQLQYQNEQFNTSNYPTSMLSNDSQTMRLQDAQGIQQYQQQQQQQYFIPQQTQHNSFTFPLNLQQNQQRVFSDIQQTIFNQQQNQQQLQQQQQQIPQQQQLEHQQLQDDNSNQDTSGMIIEHEQQQSLNIFPSAVAGTTTADQSQVMYQQQLDEQQQLFSEFTLDAPNQSSSEGQQQDMFQQEYPQQQQQLILPNDEQQLHQRGRTIQQQQYTYSPLQNVDSRSSSHSRTQGTLLVLGNSSRLPQYEFGSSSTRFQTNPIEINQLARQRSASSSSSLSGKQENPASGSIERYNRHDSHNINSCQPLKHETYVTNKALAQQFKHQRADMRHPTRSASCEPARQLLANVSYQSPQQMHNQTNTTIYQQQQQQIASNIQGQSPSELSSASQFQQLPAARPQQRQVLPQQNNPGSCLFQSDSLHYNTNNNKNTSTYDSNTNHRNLSSSSQFSNQH